MVDPIVVEARWLKAVLHHAAAEEDAPAPRGHTLDFKIEKQKDHST